MVTVEGEGGLSVHGSTIDRQYHNADDVRNHDVTADGSIIDRQNYNADDVRNHEVPDAWQWPDKFSLDLSKPEM